MVTTNVGVDGTAKHGIMQKSTLLAQRAITHITVVVTPLARVKLSVIIALIHLLKGL
jgi:hypothetical protein